MATNTGMDRQLSSGTLPAAEGPPCPPAAERRTFTIRTRFSSLRELQRAMPLLVQDDGTLFIPAPDAGLEPDEWLTVRIATFDGRGSVTFTGILARTIPASRALAGLALRLVPEDPGRQKVTTEMEPVELDFSDEGTNPLAGLSTAMIALFVDCWLEDKVHVDLTRSWDDVPCFTGEGPATDPEIKALPPQEEAPPMPDDVSDLGGALVGDDEERRR